MVNRALVNFMDSLAMYCHLLFKVGIFHPLANSYNMLQLEYQLVGITGVIM